MKQRVQSFQDLFFININPVIRLLIFSDVLIVGAASMWAPLFAIFVEDFIVGGNALVVSVAMGVYLVSRSLFQIPSAALIDHIRGERDDFQLMVVFSFISNLLIMLYLCINQPWQLYVVHFFLGISTAVTFPSYMAIFSRHIDRHKEGTEWGLYYTLTDLSSAALAVFGGYIATVYGFQPLILLTAGIGIVGSAALMPIRLVTKLR